MGRQQLGGLLVVHFQPRTESVSVQIVASHLKCQLPPRRLPSILGQKPHGFAPRVIVLRRCFTLLLLASCFARAADSTVVFNELMYHPATNEAALEWVELHNQMAVDMDLSAWSIEGGVEFQFLQGTVLRGGAHLVVALDPVSLQAATGITNVVGPFIGRLANAGERLELRNNNHRLMDVVSYGVEGDWPVGPDGSGVSLAKADPNTGSAPAQNWVASAQIGGTPGARNVPDGASSTPEPRLRFNEVAGASDALFWLELLNASESDLAFGGCVLALAGATDAEYVFPAEPPLPAGGRALIEQAQLGVKPKSGDRLFLFSPDRAAVLDAVVVKKTLRGRDPEGTGRWLAPSQPTPGDQNVFAFRDEIVINEIMYHHRAVPETPAVFDDTLLLPIEATWKYDQSGNELGTAWREPGFDDSAWASGPALLYVEGAGLPAPKNTPLTLGRTTYYFRTEFDFTSDTNNLTLQLHPVIDDGAVFYLNGVEVYRFNMPEGTVTYDLFAGPAVSDATFLGPFTIPTENLRLGKNVLAVEVHQASAGSTDIVFGTELLARVQVSPAKSYQTSPESWLELFNRSDHAVDLTGWRLDEGIEFGFDPGTIMPAGGYLVVAKDAAFLRAIHPDIPIVGNFTNRLSHRSDLLVLKDAADNPADEVRYFDDKPWPAYADGGGSSLELRDPRADNAKPEAWAASGEASQAPWKSYSYRGPATQVIGPTRWNEFVLGLLDAGEVLLDDLSVIESPDTPTAREVLQNGSFENGAASWRIIGNHSGKVIAAADDPANHVLHLVATGATEHMHNHAETTLTNNAAIVSGREYSISFRAKCVAGANQLHARLYFNRLARTTLLEVPARNGTPGRRNSRFEENIGPTFSELRHSPVVPAANQPVTLSVRASDPDGVAACTLWWTTAGTSWTQTPMALSAAGRYSATIPGRPASTVVQFLAEATDARGALASYPAGGQASRALYKVNDSQANLSKLHNLRIVMLPAEANAMHAATNVMSNGARPATVIYDEREVFYDVGVHLQASERGRAQESRVGFTIQFPADHLFRGVHDSVTIDRSGGYSGRGGRQDEIVLRHIMNQAGGLPDMYNDLARVIFPRALEGLQAGPGLLTMAKHKGEFLDDSYANGSDGTLFKLELVYFPTTTVGGNPQNPKLPEPDDVLGTDLQDLGDDKEVYRWNYLTENNRGRDDYRPLIELCKAFGLSGAALDARSRELLDVDQWLRVFALKSLSGDADTYAFGYPHNQLIYFRPADGKALTFPWDMDFSWTRGATESLLPGANIGRIISLPGNLHFFYGHVLDLLNSSFNTAYLSRWT
ncbi:MAG: lamin tail domain-containing protein, partial [Verrucomicrobia bacterium]|nr:lamin tail domain-containing protein [Verrucomicrobiota bacterium]